jgi:hypothetical protein
MAPVKLILHFDINQTLILEDKAGGDTFEDALNLIVCKSAFVRIKGGGGTAQEAKEATSVDQLEWMNGHPIDGSAVDPNKVVCTSWDWPPGCVPFHRVALLKGVGRAFTEKGNPGHPLRGVYKRLREAMTIPETDTPVDARLTTDCGKFWLVVPSFFEMLAGLTMTLRNFSLVFRTYGSEAAKVVHALNAFAEGKHPFARGVPSLASDPEDAWTGRYQDDGKYTLTRTAGVATTALDETAAVKRLEDRDAEGPSAHAVVDDYAWWKANYHAPEAGKPLWIDLADKRCHHVFFDDNIHNSDADSIVAVRVRDRETAPFTPLSGFRALHLQGVFLVRVPTMLAILDDTWFLARLQDAEQKKADLQKGGRLAVICRGRHSALDIKVDATKKPR